MIKIKLEFILKKKIERPLATKGIGIGQETFMTYIAGIQAGIKNTSYITDGIQAGIENHAGERVNGLQFGIKNHASSIKGMQAGYKNIANGYGIQAGIINETDDFNGLEIGIKNNSQEDMAGIQIGIENKVSDYLNGIQIGVINYAKKGTYLQIGLLNIKGAHNLHELKEDSQWHKKIIPFIRINKEEMPQERREKKQKSQQELEEYLIFNRHLASHGNPDCK